MSLLFVFLKILVKLLKWYICQFDEIFIVNTEQLVIHQCKEPLLDSSLCNMKFHMMIYDEANFMPFQGHK